MSAHHGAGMSNVGHGAFYEAGDQRNEPRSMANERERYKEGQHGSHHDLDSSMFVCFDSVPSLPSYLDRIGREKKG